LLETSAAESQATVDRAPLNATEKAIADVWKEILKLSAIGPDENFFHVGGDSLRAIQSVLQINRALRSNITITHVFQAPTIRALARKVDTAKPQAVPDIRRVRAEKPRTTADVASLSDAEVDSLLAQLLVEKK
jgi:aryl carrier-like protein